MAQQIAATRAEKLMLLHKGTDPCRLSPGAIIQAANADLRHRNANAEIRRLRKNGMAAKDTGTLYQYAFHSRHLQGSTTAADVIRKAIKDHSRGASASDVGRARIYRDVDLLHEALAAAEAA